MRLLLRAVVSTLLCSTIVFADQQPKRLPEPLTLPSALAIASDQNPDVMLAQVNHLLADAQRQGIESKENLQLRFEGGLVRREFNGRAEDYHNAYLVLQKQLYDFNKTQLNIQAAQAQIAAQEALVSFAKSAYRQAVVIAYYDVLLADMTYRVENEQTAIEYVTLDNARDEARQGKLSALELLALEAPYQKTLVRRGVAENKQRSSRAALAELLGYPNSLPEELETPAPVGVKSRPTLDSRVLQQQAIDHNLELIAMRHQQLSAELKLQATEKMDLPRVDAVGRAGWHTNVETLYEGRWRYDLVMSMPLIDGGLKASEVDKAKAELMRLRAQSLAVERQIRQAVLETTLQLDMLTSREKQVKVSGDYAEMLLDKNRTEYQLERKTDLGDSMVRATRAELESLQLARDRAVLWETLQHLLGER